jgi:hypothetical protein
MDTFCVKTLKKTMACFYAYKVHSVCNGVPVYLSSSLVDIEEHANINYLQGALTMCCDSHK